MKMPSLSVVFPNYNHARYLPVQLSAILQSSYRSKEIIIIDDASTDNSVEIIKNFMCHEPCIKLIRNQRNMGVEWNFNRLVEMASGEYMYLSAADDKILPGFFEKSMTLLAQYPQAGLCSTVGRFIDEDGNDRGIRAMPVISNRPCYLSPKEVKEKLCRYGRWISTPTMIVRRDAVIQEGGQILELGAFADTFLALVVALRHGSCFIPEPLTCWRKMSKGHSSSSATDWEGSSAMFQLACRLMRTKYRDLFPIKYVHKFERQWRYALSASIKEQVYLEHKRITLRAFKIMCPTPSFADKTFWVLMRMIDWLRFAAWWAYSVGKYATWSWWIKGRLSIIINLRKIILVDKMKRRLD